MTNFLKVSEAPKTKLQLKKAILKGSIVVFERDMNRSNDYTKLNSANSILSLWDGFRYHAPYQGSENEANAYLGTSFNYKFANA
jgi:hypothetical protein